MAFLQSLEAMAPAQFHFDDEAAGKFLDVTSIIAETPKDAHLYCCGPTPMLKAFEAATADWPREQIHVEYFTPKQEVEKKGGFVVELARCRTGIRHSRRQDHPAGAARCGGGRRLFL